MQTVKLSSIEFNTLLKSIRLSLYVMQEASQNDAEADKLRAVRAKLYNVYKTLDAEYDALAQAHEASTNNT
jgi:hypothetical protein